jgi:RNase P protein component
MTDIRNIYISEDSVKFVIGDLLKTSSLKNHLAEMNFVSYRSDIDLCIVNIIFTYLQQTDQLRGSLTRLLITTQKPHRSVSRDTIRRWLRIVMQKSGIDV